FKRSSSAYKIPAVFAGPESPALEIDAKIYSSAVHNFFGPQISKHNTLFDCIIAAVAKEYRADAIFSFDKFYRKLGFKLAEDILL
ncbi:MAG: hypothetical protein AAB893_03555, partial [Patescibacteria group bacterium]